MKTAKIIALIVAICSIFAGIFIAFIGFAMIDFNIEELNTVNFAAKAYNIENDFTKISIIGAECDVKLLPTDQNETKIVCSESDKIYHNVNIESETLTIERVDKRKWTDLFGIYWADMEIVIYLPKSEYEKLQIETLSGDIESHSEFIFDEIDFDTASGDIEFSAASCGNFNLKTISGDIHLRNISAKELKTQTTSGDVEINNAEIANNLTVKTTSGEIDTTNISCKSLTADSTSGDCELEKLIASGNIKITTLSGEIGLELCDAETLFLKSTSGSIHGTLLSDKKFEAHTVSGRINVPKSNGDDSCEIRTTSGNISIKISK